MVGPLGNALGLGTHSKEINSLEYRIACTYLCYTREWLVDQKQIVGMVVLKECRRFETRSSQMRVDFGVVVTEVAGIVK
jgi:hypothetical protein